MKTQQQVDWAKCIVVRKGRMVKLLELNAPDALIAYEAQLLRKAHRKIQSDLRMATIDFYFAIHNAVIIRLLQLRIKWWMFCGMSKDEAMRRVLDA